MPSKVRISSASYEDLPEIARIHVAAWRQAYAGQVPQAHLDNLSVADRLRRWQEQFSNHAVSGLLVASVNDEIAGFVCFGRYRDEDRAEWGEIYAIYVIEPYWGRGLGYQLYQRARGELNSIGYSKAYLWVLDTNRRAIAAYERWGGVIESGRQKDHEIGGQAVKEVSIAFALESQGSD
jgi:GNAT superfamily N-acetyltransferase